MAKINPLRLWLDKEGQQPYHLAETIGVSLGTIYEFMNPTGRRLGRTILWAIVGATRGEVTYDQLQEWLADRTKERRKA